MTHTFEYTVTFKGQIEVEGNLADAKDHVKDVIVSKLPNFVQRPQIIVKYRE